jgi:hypothetical protein
VKSGWGVLSSSKTIGRVYTSEAYYVFAFEPNGSITICDILDLNNNDVIELIETALKNDGKRLEKIETLDGWLDIVRDGERRYLDISGNDVQQAERGGELDVLDGQSYSGNAGGDRTPSGKTNSKDVINYSYTPPESETFDELLSQHKRGLITDEEFKEGLFPQKPTDPLSLINTKPEYFGATPDVNKKTGTFDGDREHVTVQMYKLYFEWRDLFFSALFTKMTKEFAKFKISLSIVTFLIKIGVFP